MGGFRSFGVAGLRSRGVELRLIFYVDSFAAETNMVEEQNYLIVTCTLLLELGERTQKLYFMWNMSVIVTLHWPPCAELGNVYTKDPKAIILSRSSGSVHSGPSLSPVRS